MTTPKETPMMTIKRTVAYAQEGITDLNGNYMVAYVTENEAGYYETTYTGTLDYCRGVADAINESRSYNKQDVLDVVASSFAAQNA